MTSLFVPFWREYGKHLNGIVARAIDERKPAAYVRWFPDAESLEPYVSAWDELAENASEPNVFLESWYLLPAMRLLRENANLMVALVFARNGNANAEQLIGVLPLEKVRTSAGINVLRFWKHPHCFLCTPLILAGFEAAFWEAVLRELDEQRWEMLLQLPSMSVDGAVFEALNRQMVAQERLSDITGVYARAVLMLHPASDEYHDPDSSVTRDFAKRRRRLERLGEVSTHSLEDGDDPARWLANFLHLEQKGWKGAAQTAINCNVAQRQFVEEIIAAAHERNRLSIIELRIDDEVIATQVNLLGTQDSAFAYKVAYDEDYASYSPGMLLEAEAIRIVHQQRRFRWMDCCCAFGNTTMNRLWKERRALASVMLPARRMVPELVASLIPMMRYARRILRRTATKAHCVGLCALSPAENALACCV